MLEHASEKVVVVHGSFSGGYGVHVDTHLCFTYEIRSFTSSIFYCSLLGASRIELLFSNPAWVKAWREP